MEVSIFEIIGPIMVGPSSSGTAGMARIGNMVRSIVGEEPLYIEILLHPAVSSTYKMHKTDVALVGGLLGMSADSPGLKEALTLASQKRIDIKYGFLSDEEQNPKTVIIKLRTKGGSREVTGISVGGGSFIITNIDGAPVQINGSAYHLLIWGKNVEMVHAVKAIRSVSNGEKPITAGYSRTNDGYLRWMSFTREIPRDWLEELQNIPLVENVRLIPPILSYGLNQWCSPLFSSLEELLTLTQKENCQIPELVLRNEAGKSGKTPREIIDLMREHLAVMRLAVEEGLRGERELVGGIAGGKDGKRLAEAALTLGTVSGSTVPMAMARAMAVVEVNASMGQVVAAPTAGSSGIIPGCLLTLQERLRATEEQVVGALLVAAGLGVIMAQKGISFSGLIGGCQAEVGVSSALAAAGLVQLAGGGPEQIIHAAAIAIKNTLGLSCDLVGGPVEVPCIKRNAMGVANAYAAADMALAGIKSNIPPDDVLLALKNSQQMLSSEQKGSPRGCLARTPSGMQWKYTLENKYL